tara:strand:+ start:2236 stop:2988 length:753 start_codon:yes stop_codon:yes gene_type:complete
MNDFQDKTIWIIGASSGIGAALARELSHRGAHLILSARREEELKVLNRTMGGGHTVRALDIADAATTRQVADDLVAAGHDLDGVIFLAALYSPHDGKTKDIEMIHKMLDVNLGGAFNTVHAVQPYFEKRGKGQIVLCGSVAGYRGLPTGQPYCATKAAIINLAESLHVDLGRKNIDVKVICPGFVRTPLTDKNDFKMPMMIEPEEAARAIARGLQSRAFEIHFPKGFTYIMKFVRLLPNWLYFKLIKRVV